MEDRLGWGLASGAMWLSVWWHLNKAWQGGRGPFLEEGVDSW